ncbi:acyltransferase family protein [Flavobacterium sp. N1736]|uniref:acyltransferase family protein n=1 Tax=Flavobacterium sp. N1736 TaxID=2986823 RepID=UPI002224DDBF|nr:acyltransferase [Flavobacterium sp. N1736]
MMRIEQLTFTRFIAAILIVIFHYGKNSYVFNNSYVDFLLKQANVCVSYFFILSGFVMIVAYQNKSQINTFEYLKNRFARIYPVYLLGIVLVLIPLILSKTVNFQDLFLNLFMLQSWIPGKALTLNVPGWSLSVECFFYIVFPFFFNSVYKKFNIKTITIAIVSFWLISQIALHIMIPTNPIKGFPLSTTDLFYFPLMHLNEFLAGNLAGIYFINRLSASQKNVDWSILMVLLLIILALKFPVGLIYHNGMLALLFIPLIILISLNNGILTSIFKSKICVFLGEISFGIYILQYPVWVWMTDYRLKKYFQIDKVEDFTLGFFIRLFALIIIAAISYIILEVPVRNKIKNFRLKLTEQL